MIRSSSTEVLDFAMHKEQIYILGLSSISPQPTSAHPAGAQNLGPFPDSE
jgi:hypothetical protein